MIDLFEHNRIAYESAVAMLEKTGKAAIVHPTGTGKSFIGFKLCEDNSDKVICWLSPSEYIFKTQLENLKAASNGYEPKNVVFYTYAKLMLMSEEEIAEISPSYIVFDEFHRCGAEMWGRGVNNLLNAYPGIPILGLSATNIRYLDNQRDMADELFDGNIASEMTLGEAIVRGILNPPKYVLSMFCYQQSLEKYEIRAQDQIDRLTSIGMDWLNSIERSWHKGIEHSKEYAREFGNLNVIVSYVCPDGYALGEWLHAQRTHRKRLDPSKVAVLRSIGATGFDGSEVSSEA